MAIFQGAIWVASKNVATKMRYLFITMSTLIFYAEEWDPYWLTAKLSMKHRLSVRLKRQFDTTPFHFIVLHLNTLRAISCQWFRTEKVSRVRLNDKQNRADHRWKYLGVIASRLIPWAIKKWFSRKRYSEKQKVNQCGVCKRKSLKEVIEIKLLLRNAHPIGGF